MPRNIAEYIQASSRVARDELGLVLTVHHPYRSRDISHYEKFIEFHEKFYGYVEPISITPFTQKALDRYLGLYLAVILRHKIKDFSNREGASRIINWDIEKLVDKLTEYFSIRMEKLKKDENLPHLIKSIINDNEVYEILKWFHRALEYWRNEALENQKNGNKFVFNHKSGKNEVQLFFEIDEYSANIKDKKWVIPQSLRAIDPEAVIRIKQI